MRNVQKSLYDSNIKMSNEQPYLRECNGHFSEVWSYSLNITVDENLWFTSARLPLQRRNAQRLLLLHLLLLALKTSGLPKVQYFEDKRIKSGFVNQVEWSWIWKNIVTLVWLQQGSEWSGFFCHNSSLTWLLHCRACFFFFLSLSAPSLTT